jgi:3-methylfumaryl-CoA hydratase
MWAGGELRFEGELRVGDTVIRRSRIADVTVKSGRSGTLCFVAVEHEISSPRGVAVRERHDIVYRDIAPGTPSAQPQRAPEAGPQLERSRKVMADPVLLFRYSALTFNGHRIHYDRDYVTGVEGYSGLIVHGPLQATLLVHMAADMLGRAPAIFTYRGVRPLFDGAAFTVNGTSAGDGVKVWTADAAGQPTMTAEAS